VGGASALPSCPGGAPTFSVCAVSDADVLPLAKMARDSVMAAAATVEAIGAGTAPAQCQSARLFGAATGSDWWVQVRTADTTLWTIGLHGFNNPPGIQTGDSVTLDVQIQRSVSDPVTPQPTRSTGFVQLSNAAGTPLVWAGSDVFMTTWMTLATGRPLCLRSGFCGVNQDEIVATINGSVATLMPFSSAQIGGYDVSIGANETPTRPTMSSGSSTGCAFEGPVQFAAAAVKTP
jgi:hypothetical protein